jgi:hypothetical protein
MASHYSPLKTCENKWVQMCKTVGPNILLLKGNPWQSSYDADSQDNTYLYSQMSVISLKENH